MTTPPPSAATPGAARLRCVVAEDEPEARLNLLEYLTEAPWIEVAGVAADGREAVRLVDERRPDVLLLDVRLPELDGIGVLRALSHRPEVVFTTAYETYALTAFELGALDYVLKPFGRERLLKALERVRERLRERVGERAGEPGSVERALAATAPAPLSRLFARQGACIVPIPAGEIVRIEAQGDYAEVHATGGRYLLHITMKELLRQLDPSRFEAVHRSHIVNLDAVTRLRTIDDRRLELTLRDGSRLVASRSASERLRRLAR